MTAGITWIRGDRVIPGNGAPAIAHTAILVRDGRIVAVGPAGDPDLTPPPGARVVDLPGHTLLPGLIDCHTHPGLEPGPDHRVQLLEDSQPLYALKGADHLRRTLEAGVTSTRSMGERVYAGPAWKAAMERGLISGPRLWVSGRILTIPGGHEDWHHPFGIPDTQGLCAVVSGAEEARRAAREEIKAGADVIKLCATGGILSATDEPGAQELSLEEMQAAVQEARRTGRHAAAHAQGTQGIKDAIRAGVRSIEHGSYLDDEAIEMILQSGVYLVPTLSALDRILAHGAAAGIPRYAVEKASAAAEAHAESFARAVRAGVRIAMGTDAGTPFNAHGENPRELELMVRAGMTPGAAIASATQVAAELLGDLDIGQLAPGKLADIVAVPGDPLADIRLLQQVTFVMQGGQVIKSPPSALPL